MRRREPSTLVHGGIPVRERYKRGVAVLAVLAALLLPSAAAVAAASGPGGSDANALRQPIEYLEDPSGVLTLEELAAPGASDRHRFTPADALAVGSSRSVFWVRMVVSGDDDRYLAVINPTVQRVEAFFPVKAPGGIVIVERQALGWGVDDASAASLFLYPAFRIPANLASDQAVYLRLSSVYTQNYQFRLLSEEAFADLRLRSAMLFSIFVGVLFALGASNFLNYLFLKDRTHVWYLLYILAMLAYQGSLLGGHRLVLAGAAEALVAQVVPLGLLMVAAALQFFRSFLGTDQHFPRSDRAARLLTILALLAAAASLAGLRYETAIVSTLLGDLAGLLIFGTSVAAVARGIAQAKYFAAGWALMLLSLGVFSARVWGLLPNNELTLGFVLLAAAGEAMFLSAALADRIRVLRGERERAMAQAQRAELDAIHKETAFLQAQIKPHFLYNALNIIAALCRIDGERARTLILDLSRYLRHSFDFSNMDRFIRLEEELDSIRAYVAIEQARFKDKLKVAYEIEGADGLLVPPLLLQPLLENAIRHGIRKGKGTGTVTLRVRRAADHYLLEVEDDGAGMSEEQIRSLLDAASRPESGVGLANIRRRLRVLYDTDLLIESRPGAGTKCTIRLPLADGRSQEGAERETWEGAE